MKVTKKQVEYLRDLEKVKGREAYNAQLRRFGVGSAWDLTRAQASSAIEALRSEVDAEAPAREETYAEMCARLRRQGRRRR